MAENIVPQQDKPLESQTGGGVSIQATKHLSTQHQIAALLYYNEIGVKVQFENADVGTQEKYMLQAGMFFVILGKLDLIVTKKVDTKKIELTEQETFNRLAEIIRDFVKKLKHPKNIGQFFPVEELAKKILEGGK